MTYSDPNQVDLAKSYSRSFDFSRSTLDFDSRSLERVPAKVL